MQFQATEGGAARAEQSVLKPGWWAKTCKWVADEEEGILHELSGCAVAIYKAIEVRTTWRGDEPGPVCISHETLATITGYSTVSIRKRGLPALIRRQAIAELSQGGGRGNTGVYQLITTPPAQPALRLCGAGKVVLDDHLSAGKVVLDDHLSPPPIPPLIQEEEMQQQEGAAAAAGGRNGREQVRWALVAAGVYPGGDFDELLDLGQDLPNAPTEIRQLAPLLRARQKGIPILIRELKASFTAQHQQARERAEAQARAQAQRLQQQAVMDLDAAARAAELKAVCRLVEQLPDDELGEFQRRAVQRGQVPSGCYRPEAPRESQRLLVAIANEIRFFLLDCLTDAELLARRQRILDADLVNRPYHERKGHPRTDLIMCLRIHHALRSERPAKVN